MSAAEMIKAVVQRVEALEADKAQIGDDIKAVYAEAKANGLDPKALRKVVRLRAIPTEQRQEEKALLEMYMDAVGMS